MVRDRPKGVTAIAILTTIEGLGAILGALYSTFLAMMGGEIGPIVQIAGLGGVLVFLAIAVLTFYTAWGAWSLKPWSWTVLIVLNAIGILSSLVMLLLSLETLRGSLFGLALSSAILLYLIQPKVRAVFGKS